MQRLVHHTNPEARETPILLLASLREIDPTVELLYAGDRIWWLGSVSANEARAERGRVMLAQLNALDEHLKDRPSIARSIMLGKVVLQGFALIEAYRDHGDPSGVVTVAWDTPIAYDCSMIEDFRDRDDHWRRDQGRTVMADKMSVALGDEKQARAEATIKHYLATDGRDHYRREMRHRVSFGPAGMTGGSGRLIHP